MKFLIGLIMVAVTMTTMRPVFAEDYRERNVFNHVSDFGSTFWRNPEDKERMINERIDMRAQRRQNERHDRDRNLDKNYREDKRNMKQDYDQKKYDNNH